MVEKISVQIALEGTEEIKRQLAGVSEAGQQCFADISAAAAKAGGFNKLDPAVVEQKFKQFGITATTEINKISAAVQSAGKLEALVGGVDELEKNFKKASAAAATTAGEIKKITAAVKSIGRLEGLITGVAALESGFFAIAVAIRAINAALTLGPAGLALAAISVAVVALSKALFGAADAISKIDAEAIKLGTTIEQFDKLRQGFLRAGIAADAITAGIQHFKTELDRIQLDRVQQAFEKAQKSIAAGWFPATEQLNILRNAANGVGPAAEAARRALDQLGQPFKDTVTPAFEGMVRWAGSATKAIPQIAAELERLGTSGERARLITLTLERIASEAGGVVPGIENIVKALQQMPDSVERNNAILKLFGDQLGTQLIQSLRTGSVNLEQFRTQLTQSTANTANQVEQNLNKIKAAFSEALTTLPLQTVAQGLQTVAQNVQATADKLGTISWDSFTSGATTAFGSVNTGVTTANASMDSFIGKINEAIRGLAKLQVPSAPSGGGGGGGSSQPSGNAAGGLLGGRGTGTSDSNLAWVSRGEHIMPARAVAQPGVLALLEALRRSGGNLSSVLNGMGRFALGGMVPRAMPAFAGGGKVGSSSRNLGTLTLVTADGIVSGLTDAKIAEALGRVAVRSQVTSGGRKPSRYG